MTINSTFCSFDFLYSQGESKDFFHWNKPSHNGAQATLGQAILTLMAFVITIRLTQALPETLLKLLSILLPSDSALPTPKYFFTNSSRRSILHWIIIVQLAYPCLKFSDATFAMIHSIMHDWKKIFFFSIVYFLSPYSDILLKPWNLVIN